MQPQLLTTSQVAKFLNVSRSYVYWLISRRKLISIRFGHAVRVDPADLTAYIREHKLDKNTNAQLHSSESADQCAGRLS